jgi:hypothetical protein
LSRVSGKLPVKYGQVKDSNVVEEIISEIVSQLHTINNIHFVEGRPPDFEPVAEVEKLLLRYVSRKSETTTIHVREKSRLNLIQASLSIKGYIHLMLSMSY